MKSQKLINLEHKFGLAETLVENLGELVVEMGDTSDLMVPDINSTTESIMDMNCLKRDFALVRDHIITLVDTGQRILKGASVLDISDLKASQLEALSTLQSTIGNNLSLLLQCYKDIAAIEKSKQKPIVKSEPCQSINNGSVINNQVMFTGSSSELLKLINQTPIG